jgi:hypothetical protein
MVIITYMCIGDDGRLPPLWLKLGHKRNAAQGRRCILVLPTANHIAHLPSHFISFVEALVNLPPVSR